MGYKIHEGLKLFFTLSTKADDAQAQESLKSAWNENVQWNGLISPLAKQGENILISRLIQ